MNQFYIIYLYLAFEPPAPSGFQFNLYFSNRLEIYIMLFFSVKDLSNEPSFVQTEALDETGER